jgi:hypothetical protein
VEERGEEREKHDDAVDGAMLEFVDAGEKIDRGSDKGKAEVVDGMASTSPPTS